MSREGSRKQGAGSAKQGAGIFSLRASRFPLLPVVLATLGLVVTQACAWAQPGLLSWVAVVAAAGWAVVLRGAWDAWQARRPR